MSVSSHLGEGAAPGGEVRPAFSAGREQLARLFQLVGLLHAGDAPNARELADECEVSRRTIHRDLRLLRDAGVPIDFDRDSLGYHLSREAFLPPTNLTVDEAIALLILGHQGAGLERLGLASAARSGAVKVVQGLPSEIRDRVVVTVGSSRPEGDLDAVGSERRTIRRHILDAIVRQSQVRLWYHPSSEAPTESTKFSIYRLILADGEWFLVGRASSLRRVVVIGLPWVDRAEATNDPARVPPRFNLHRFLGRAWFVRDCPFHYQVWMRFDARASARILDTAPRRGERRERLAGGKLDVHLEVDGLDEITGWLLTFGDSVEVLAPNELRAQLRDLGERIARRHMPLPAIDVDLA
ncbi:MAG: WYL domain-containing protein [Isosphaeraceae bacterium]